MNEYLILKALHLIMITCWFAGLFYLPRLFVYHHQAEVGSKMYDTFVIMERKLLMIIMFPSMIITVLLGLALVYIDEISSITGWFHVKVSLVALLVVYQYMLSRYQKDFAKGQNKHSEKFYRIINEIPAIILVLCVLLAVCKPF
jgi:protoporphyrinogen IX oxidase